MFDRYFESENDWQRKTSVLNDLDTKLTDFSNAHNFYLKKNDHNWPSRIIEWQDRYEKSIEIFMSDEFPGKFHYLICASKDIGNDRFLTKQYLKTNTSIQEKKLELDALLKKSMQILNKVSDDDLEFAIKLLPPPMG